MPVHEAPPITLHNEAILKAQAPELANRMRKLLVPANPASLGIVAIDQSPEAQKLLGKRRHDLKGALRTLELALAALDNGYQFNDDKAPAKRQALHKAVAVLKDAAELLTALYDLPGSL